MSTKAAIPLAIRFKSMVYRTIFTIVTENTASTVTARYAIALASAVNARLVLYAAHAGDNERTTIHSERHLDHLFAVVHGNGIPVTRITETGAITDLLPKRVRAEKADLVFYPLATGEEYDTPLQGAIVHSFMQSIKADLAIMRIVHMGKPHPGHILVPLGGIVGQSERRINFLAAMAKCFHSHVTLFHRVQTEKKIIPQDIIRLRDALRLHHLNILERTGTGHIGKSIILEAISHHNDLIIMGASERSILRRLFFGDPAGHVISRPPCNAILFRPAPES